MSTILQALQKSKSDQAGAPPPIIQTDNKLLHWKVMLSFSVVIIVVLLGALSYLLINPINEAKQAVIPELTSVEEVNSEIELVQDQENKKIVKVNFDTQPLAIIPPKPITQPIKKVPKAPIATNEKQIVISAEPVQKQEIQYEQEEVQEPSSELKERFELALLLSQIEENGQNIATESDAENEASDGSNIYQMSRNFQNRVPTMLYGAHVYSSVIKDRWIRINGERLTEGDFDSTGQLELIEIQPQRSIFRLDRQSFSVESLVDWKGY